MVPPQNLPRSVPACAGVLIFDQGQLLLTLGDRDRWEYAGEWTLIPLSGVGGGVDAGEDFLHAAWRECGEELGVYPNIRHAPITYHYAKTHEATEIELPEPAPLLWTERALSNTGPFASKPPTGTSEADPDTLHIVTYRADIKSTPEPVDVPGLCWLTPKALVAMAMAEEPIPPDYPGLKVMARSLPDKCRFFLPSESVEVDLASFIHHGKIYL